MSTRILEAQAVISAVDRTGGTFRKIAGEIAKGNTRLETVGRSMALAGGALTAGVTLPLVGLGKASLDAAVEFESSFAGVRKVLGDLPADRVAELKREVIDLSTEIPLAAEEFNAIFEGAAQAGVAQQQLGGFARLAAETAVAFDGASDQIGEDLAKIKTAGNFSLEALGDLTDVINELSNTSASAAPDLVSIVQDVGGIGRVAGLAYEQTAALGAAMVSMGAGSDVASTAIKNLSLNLTRGENVTAKQSGAFKALGLEAVEVARSMQTDAAGTIRSVFGRLANLPEYKRASVAMAMFGKESLGAIGPLIDNLGQLDEVLELVGDRSRWTGSRAAEFASQMDTAENQALVLRNNVEALRITLGDELLPVFKEGLKGAVGIVRSLNDELGPQTTARVIAIGGGLAALGPILLGLGTAAVGVSKAGGAIGRLVGAAGGLAGAGRAVGRFALRFGPQALLITGAVKEWDATLAGFEKTSGGLVDIVAGQAEVLAGIATGDFARARAGLVREIDGLEVAVEGGFEVVAAAVRGGFALVDEAILEWAPPEISAGWATLRNEMLGEIDQLERDVLPGLERFGSNLATWSRSLAQGDFAGASEAMRRMGAGLYSAAKGAVEFVGKPPEPGLVDLFGRGVSTPSNRIGSVPQSGGLGRFAPSRDAEALSRIFLPRDLAGRPLPGSGGSAGIVQSAGDPVVKALVETIRRSPILLEDTPGPAPIAGPLSPFAAPQIRDAIVALGRIGSLPSERPPLSAAATPAPARASMPSERPDMVPMPTARPVPMPPLRPQAQPTFDELVRGVGKLEAEVTGPIPAEVSGPVTAELKGRADVNVKVQVQGPGRVTGLSARSQGDIAADVGVGMQDAVP